MIDNTDVRYNSAWGYNPKVHQPELYKAWHKFISTGIIEKSVVQQYIADSWKRSRGYGIDPIKLSSDAYLDNTSYRDLIKQNKRLINLASPIMKNLFESFGKAKFVTALYDKSGYHLIRLAQLKDLRKRDNEGIHMGLRFDERTVGTCGFSLAKRLKKTVTVAGCEHYLSLLHGLSSVYSPIFSPQKKHFLGVIAVGGASFVHYPHAESIVVAASTAIENLVALDQAKKKLTVYSKTLQLTIDSLDEGIIVIDRKGQIFEMNLAAQKIFGKVNTSMASIHLSEVKGCEPLVQQIDHTMNSSKFSGNQTECRIGTQTYILETKVVRDHENKLQGIQFNMKNIQKLSCMVNGITGNQPKYRLKNLVGSSQAMAEVKNTVLIAADSNGPVIIEGESGTGKEVVAQAIHNASRRRKKPFVAVNCAAVPLELIESIVFGHEKGAFTGATRTQIGKFELADGGTLFFDEIGDMPESMQAKLLRAIEERRIERIGGKQSVPTDVRILAATNKNLYKQIQRKRFRQDLYFRLNVFSINIPPLRERKEDIPKLVNHIVGEFAPILKKRIRNVSKGFINILMEQDLPGNVRELRNAIHNSMARAQGSSLTSSHLKGFFPQKNLAASLFMQQRGGGRLVEMEKQTIFDMLKKCGGNKTQAANALGIGRATLYRKLSGY